MKVVAFVPIKLNSERLENKNILPFDNGIPLTHYIQRTLLKVQQLSDIYIYCSDSKIADYTLEGVKFLKRDSYLDKSETPFNEVLVSFAEKVEADIYVLTHTTAPFIKSESIERGIDMVLKSDNDSAIGVKRVNEFLWKDNSPLNYSLDNIPRTQDLPLIYAETCGLYIYSRNLILGENKRIGQKPYFVELSKIESLDINDEEDFIIANAVSRKISHI